MSTCLFVYVSLWVCVIQYIKPRDVYRPIRDLPPWIWKLLLSSSVWLFSPSVLLKVTIKKMTCLCACMKVWGCHSLSVQKKVKFCVLIFRFRLCWLRWNLRKQFVCQLSHFFFYSTFFISNKFLMDLYLTLQPASPAAASKQEWTSLLTSCWRFKDSMCSRTTVPVTSLHSCKLWRTSDQSDGHSFQISWKLTETELLNHEFESSTLDALDFFFWLCSD